MFRLNPAAPPSIEKHTSNETVGRGVIALRYSDHYQFNSDDAGLSMNTRCRPAPKSRIGGYFHRIYKYRDPELLEYLLAHGVSKASFYTSAFPIMVTRSPQLDLAALPFITSVPDLKKDRVGLLDHGCSAAEHFDFLDILLKASGQRPAEDVLSYIGLDYSALLPSTAQTLHRHVDERYFGLVHQEGTELNFPDRSIDVTLSVGVVNHVDTLKVKREVLSRGKGQEFAYGRDTVFMATCDDLVDVMMASFRRDRYFMLARPVSLRRDADEWADRGDATERRSRIAPFDRAASAASVYIRGLRETR